MTAIFEVLCAIERVLLWHPSRQRIWTASFRVRCFTPVSCLKQKKLNVSLRPNLIQTKHHSIEGLRHESR
jgi:hypothetical protein